MAHFRKTYFLCPKSEFIPPPPEGPLFLGSIILSTSMPESSLNRETKIPLVNELPPIIETDWKKAVSVKKKVEWGVYLQFLANSGLLVLGPSLDADHLSKSKCTFAFDEVKTMSFEPTPEYVAEAMKAPTVQQWLKEPKQRFSPVVSLYLITGMKLVKGANVKYSSSGTLGVTGRFGIDVPQYDISVGPRGRWTAPTYGDGMESNPTSDFVFAFRVKRIRITRKVKTENYTKGAFMAAGKEEDGDEIESISVDDVDGSGFENVTVVHDAAEDDDVYCVPSK
ncbi:hypothetical protein TGAM01_v203052 [Trichoderma gamsii]|uniref:Uncharacterized protein n=1 Tax=Trichoderma gamsii TaxID=398673 RepID=A0A2P4ZUE7_9HYPO|nr:hypothetical protein TGAM01_v203052 [Trichoderma gamsii]PON27915.1 hypothetical protein TGAM01_v203052 [Trichoderma gamsii]